ncbi:MAG: acetyl-CoA carboxylase biotin carboxylase subunit [Rhodothermia bacterium]|nr:acetyl-CoA carboxylase biotin carboxylase subunit [Rhodothermia bacterium]
MPRIQKVLIANRGEIAVRIARTCREMGIGTVAVYSDADQSALHVRCCDEAVYLGPAPSRDSYLRTDLIINAALSTGADAVHPGYGFLSENADFAEMLAANDIVWIGPPASAIRAMGDKTAARRLMQEAGVPVVPGTVDAVASDDETARIAEEIGYPVLLKAAAGGGGKGMRVVKGPDAISRALSAAKSEARSAFGDDRIFVEKFITAPRHIEFQILADAHGNCLHLFERECSIQRRHQKVIEEAPSAVLTDELRTAMGDSAVAAAISCGYVNAGTVEFLLDADYNFYFMEMNTRLQVEHPVTEWITGIDLVAEQIRIAEGAPLSFAQKDLSRTGHSIESRIYAEDPANSFLPDPGPLLRHRMPAGPGVRVDSGVEEGGQVEIHYDPMISKLTVWAPTRDRAISRMQRALTEYEITGVKTTIPFCSLVMETDAFRSGEFSTHFVEQHFNPEDLDSPDPGEALAMAVAAAVARSTNGQQSAPAAASPALATRWQDRRELR